jgi:hypothetical protein
VKIWQGKQRESIKYIKRATNETDFMDVIVLLSAHQHVSTIQVAILRVVRTRIQI